MVHYPSAVAAAAAAAADVAVRAHLIKQPETPGHALRPKCGPRRSGANVCVCVFLCIQTSSFKLNTHTHLLARLQHCSATSQSRMPNDRIYYALI